MSWEIELQAPLQFRIDLGQFDLAKIGQLDERSLSRSLVPYGNRQVEFGELFRTRRVANGQPEIIFRGDFGLVDGIASGNREEFVTIDGCVGNRAGTEMHGGRLTIHGAAGDDVGLSMIGGSIFVRGNAGRRVGGCVAGKKSGMQGGTIVVLGDCEVYLGERMRRGLIAVGGVAGDFAGRGMRGGTIIASRFGGWFGQEMIRGTLICQSAEQPNPAFAPGGIVEPTLTRLVRASLVRREPRSRTAFQFLAAEKWQLWHGDRLAGLRGELFESL